MCSSNDDRGVSEVRSLLDDLAAMQLTAREWAEVETGLRLLAPEDPDQTRLSQIVFEARVQQRFHAGRAASTLPPTKQTSALPWVGAACGLLLLAVGGLLGGGVVLVAVAALSVGVFAVAFAGSRVAHRRAETPVEVEPAIPMPPPVQEAAARLRGHS